MKDRINHSNHECINPTEVEVRLDAITIREDIKVSLGQTMHTEDVQDIVKIIEVGQDMILITEVVMGIIQEAIKGMGGQTIAITEGETSEVKIMIGLEVGHTKDREEIEGTVEALVIVDQGQVQGQLQIEIELDVSSVGYTITLQGTAQLDKQVGK